MAVIARSSGYSVRFHAAYASRPRSSRDPDTQQQQSVLPAHSFALLPIAGRVPAARHHSTAHCINACSPALSITQRGQDIRVDGLMLVNTTRQPAFRTPSWARATPPAFTGPVGLHPYRQGVGEETNREPFPSTIVSIAAPVDDATHPRAVPRSNLLTGLGSRMAPKFGIFLGLSPRVLDGKPLVRSASAQLSSVIQI
ncbi:hypothetical protein MKX08_007951 [Trichoderma sp. CBMAI-0020]|nr:hypothetical protein MKX08_007951 [Trichoderma sp. CBMAI-0020]